jgi:hypothetical protein
MKLSKFDASPREYQVAMSLLAHAARHDSEALATLITLVADTAEGLRATHIMAALLDQFQLGMDDEESEDLAAFYAAEAEALARRIDAA